MLLFAYAALFASSPTVPPCCAGMNAFANDPAFLAAHAAPLPFKFQDTHHGTNVIITEGSIQAGAFYVTPDKGVTTAIVMVHEFWGLNGYIKREAVRMHNKTGYAVLAIDLYGGKVGKTAEEASALMQAVNPDTAKGIVKAADDVLENGQLGVKITQIGTVGWCFGGGWSLQAAIEGGSVVKACVMYYGMPETETTRLSKLQAPVLMIEAMKDKWINPEVVRTFEANMSQLGKSLRVVQYDDDHAFANPSNPHYDATSAADAMDKTLAFFNKNLG